MDFNEQGWNYIGDFKKNYSDIERLQIQLAYRSLKEESDYMNKTKELPEEKEEKQNKELEELAAII